MKKIFKSKPARAAAALFGFVEITVIHTHD